MRAVLDDDAVDDHAYVMLDIFVEFDFFVEGIIRSVHSDSNVACALELLEFFAVFALATSDDGSEKLKFRTLSFHNLVADLIHGLTSDFTPALRAMRSADSREKKAEIIVYFRHRTHGRTGVVRGGFLVDRHGGREPLDIVHVGLLHLSEEHTSVTRKTFDVASLPLCENGVESKRGFAASAQTRKHHEFVTRYFEVDIFEVVFPCPFYDDFVDTHFFTLLLCSSNAIFN